MCFVTSNRLLKPNVSVVARDLDSSKHTMIILAEFWKITRQSLTSNQLIRRYLQVGCTDSSELYSDHLIVSWC